MIAVNCPHCRNRVKAPPAAAGQKVKCPACLAPMLIPVPTATFADPEPPPLTPGPSPPLVIAPSGPESEPQSDSFDFANGPPTPLDSIVPVVRSRVKDATEAQKKMMTTIAAAAMIVGAVVVGLIACGGGSAVSLLFFGGALGVGMICFTIIVFNRK